jgi:hypothetical protein
MRFCKKRHKSAVYIGYRLDDVASKTNLHSKLCFNSLPCRMMRGSRTSNRLAAKELNQEDSSVETSNLTANASINLDMSHLSMPLLASVFSSDEWRLETNLYGWRLTSSALSQGKTPA